MPICYCIMNTMEARVAPFCLPSQSRTEKIEKNKYRQQVGLLQHQKGVNETAKCNLQYVRQFLQVAAHPQLHSSKNAQQILTKKILQRLSSSMRLTLSCARKIMRVPSLTLQRIEYFVRTAKDWLCSKIKKSGFAVNLFILLSQFVDIKWFEMILNDIDCISYKIYTKPEKGWNESQRLLFDSRGARETPPHPYGMAQTWSAPTSTLESRQRRTKGSVVGEEWCQNAAPLRWYTKNVFAQSKMILSRAWLHDTVSCAAWNDARKGVYLKPLFKSPCSNCIEAEAYQLCWTTGTSPSWKVCL